MIVFAEEALADIERIFEFNFERDPETALDHVENIRTATLVLEQHPQIGRLIRSVGGAAAGRPRPMLRELVISQGKTGYVALYEYSQVEKLVRVVSIRHQREAGYRGR
ncbi:MAG: type II toxin-antitoxin system RelE/ParE family toxin [Betaproteobacteria bacterium]|nr:type II toxin-antitoxin system RelE/ParE family toxin [Betaproteobacteria bacterium]